MSANSGLPSDPHQWRIKHQIHTIESPTGDFTLSREEKTGIGDNGSIETTETAESKIVGGEKISSHLQIVGMCMFCNLLLTRRAIKFCFCGKVLCTACAEWDEKENKFFCPDCFKDAKRKRFWRAVWKLLTAPFIERLDK